MKQFVGGETSGGTSLRVHGRNRPWQQAYPILGALLFHEHSQVLLYHTVLSLTQRVCPYIGESATYPPFLGLFGPIRVQYLVPVPPPLETHFLELLREGGGGGRGSKIDPPFFWVENQESFGFFYFEPKKCVRVPTPWGGVGRALTQFMHFSAAFAMLAVLATSVTPCYPL